MRTFHTGGVFTGEVARQVKDFGKGTVKWGPGLITRKVRTRHGEDAEQVEVAGDLIWKGEGKKAETKAISLTPGSLVFVQNGDSVEANQLLTEVSLSKAQRSTERATKDVSSDLAGEVMFANLVPEEKTDRQGNTTRIAQRGGLVWVLSGEVYNLPPGAEAVVKNGDEVKRGSVMAETKVVSVNGGIVRLEDGSREIEIITASVLLDQAQVKLESGGGREQYVIYAADGKRFLLKTSPGTKVQNHAIIAELIDDRYRTNTGGMIRHAGVEIAKGSRKQGYEITKGGTLLWIPEETHEINKDISLLIVEDGQYVEAGTEVVKDIFCQSNGVVEVVQKNDILREIIIKPGEFHLDVDPDAVNVEAGQLVQPGTEVLPGVLVTELRQAEWIESTEGLGLLLRPVEEYPISDEPATLSQGSQNSQGGRQIELRSVQRLYYKDEERVKSVEGSQLLSTQLVLEFTGSENDSVTHLAADIELQDDEENDCKRLQLVILESLVLRRDVETDPHSGTTQTRVLVKDGQHIPAGEVLARTEIQCKEAGIVRGIKDGDEAVRRVLLVRESDRSIIDTQGKIPTVKPGDLLVAGSEIAPGVILEESGAVLRLSEPKAWEVVLDNLNQQYIEPFSRQLNSLIGFLNVEQFNLSFFGVQDTPSEKQALKKLEETEKNIRDKFINSYGEYGALYFKLRLAGKLEPAETLKLQEEKSKLPSGLEQTLIDTLDQLDQAKQEIDWSLSHRVQIRTARPYRVSGGAVLHVDDGDLVQRGDNLVLLVFERAKTGDIIQGLPRIEELLEARKPKEACVLARKPGVCQVEYQDRESVDIKIIEDDGTISEYPLLPGQNAIVADEQRVNVGDPLTDGLANPHEILDVFFSYYVENKGCYEAALMGLQAAQKFLVNQVQTVYQSQGVDISDKHIEVIVRQMTSKVRIDDGGDTTMLPGELIELRQVEQVNEAMSITGAAPARYTPVILGITKASLNTDSFISAASFQETTRVLTEAAIEGKSDWLRGLKENVIIGRLIPAGTGFNTHEDIQIANNESDDISYGRSSPERYNLTEVRTPIAEPARKTKTRSRILAKDLSSDEDMVLDDKIAREFTEEYGALQEDEDDFEESYGEDDFEEDDD